MYSDIAYSGHLAMIYLLDAEWSQRRSADYCDPYRLVQHNVSGVFRTYRDRIREDFASFLKANETQSSHLSHDQMASYLYQPLFYSPFGQSDALVITLADSFDALSSLTSKFTTTVEGLDFGFCPTLQSFGADMQGSPFVDLSEWLSGNVNDVGFSPSIQGFHEHAFQQELPLLVLSKFKVDWWGTVGVALLFEQALLRAMHERVKETLQELLGQCGNGGGSGLCDESDVSSFRCSVIDLQGEEEIALLMFCKNYSVAVSVIGSLRHMTLKDVLRYDRNNALEGAILRSPAHNAMWELYYSLCRKDGRCTKMPDKFDLRCVQGNHVFRWSNSILAASPVALLGGRHANCHGQVEAEAQLRVAPGHEWIARRLASESSRASHDEITQASGGELKYRMGVVDLAVKHGADQVSGCGTSSMSLDAAFSAIRETMEAFGGIPDRDDASMNALRKGRPAVDISTSFTIPVPALSAFRQDMKDHEPLLLTVLPYLQERLCYSADEKVASVPAGEGMESGRMNMRRLARDLERCGVPSELRRTVLFLYRDFATFLADPFLFDCVLDLYDVFATMYATLTVYLPKCRARELLRAPGEWLPALDSERVKIITQMAQGLHSALVHRVGRMYPESPIRQMSIDFRGGLTQVILAANAPLTCGLGLLRKYVVGLGPHGSSRRSVGGLTNVTLEPGTRACWFNLGVEQPVQLALIEVDPSHIIHPASYIDYLHECAHLIYRSLTSQQMVGLTLASIPSPHTADRIQEIFANLVTHLILYAGDSDVFLYHQLLSYAQRHSRRSSDDVEVIVLFSEFLIRLFMVVDCVEAGAPRSALLEQPWRRRNGTMAEVTEAFRQFLANASQLLPDYHALWKGEDSYGWRYCIRQFRDVYPQLALYMPEIWSHAAYVLRQYHKHDLHGIDADDPRIDLYHIACRALQEGRPLIRCLNGQHGHTNSERNIDTQALDPLALGCAMLYQYVSRIRDAKGKEIYLVRDPENGKIQYTNTGRVWYDFQIEIGAAAMFCPVPAERALRLKKEIAVLKTFWDIAANLRARRLLEIIGITSSEDADLEERSPPSQ